MDHDKNRWGSFLGIDTNDTRWMTEDPRTHTAPLWIQWVENNEAKVWAGLVLVLLLLFIF